VVLTVWAGNSAARAFYLRLGYDLRSEVLDREI
jgi:predicted GNAT family acetyltransferase